MLDQNEIKDMLMRGEYEAAIALCREEIESEPGRSEHYLKLGRVLVAYGDKRGAIRAFRDGLLFENNPSIREELNRLGWRDLPVIQGLGRDHWLNRKLGRLFMALRLR
jgi:tetratricopeptide (TPR) repeat protein